MEVTREHINVQVLNNLESPVGTTCGRVIEINALLDAREVHGVGCKVHDLFILSISAVLCIKFFKVISTRCEDATD
mgnify:CR=1 FL=1